MICIKLVSGGENLAEDDLRIDVVGEIQRREHQLHQITPVLVVTDVQQSGGDREE